MTPQSRALTTILNAIHTNTGFTVIVSPLPQDGGLTAEITGTEAKGRYLDIAHGKSDLTVLFLCKNTNPQTAYETLCTIGNYIDTVGSIDETDVNILGAGVHSGAGLVGNEGNYYIYSLIARISISF